MVDPLLKAYAATVLAKDASSRYSNPNRALRNYNNIMEDAERGDLSHKDEMKQYAKKLIKDAINEQTGSTKEDPKPEHDNSKLDAKEFYRFVKESKQVSNNILAKLDKLSPPPAP